MLQAQPSPTDAVTSNPWRRKIVTKNRREPVSDGSSARSQPPSYFGPYARVVAKVRRAASVLEADDGLSLPKVSVNDLERAVSAFLDEVRLGLPREAVVGGSTTSRGSSTTRGRGYGAKLKLELKDPEQAARVRQNRATVREEQAALLHRKRR